MVVLVGEFLHRSVGIPLVLNVSSGDYSSFPRLNHWSSISFWKEKTSMALIRTLCVRNSVKKLTTWAEFGRDN